MKLIIALLMTLSSTLVFADFELIKDGTTYSCTEKITSNPNAVVACINAAIDTWNGPGLPKDQAVILCRSAQNNKPVDCVKAAIDTWNGPGLAKDQAVMLCQGAQNNNSVGCVKAAIDTWNGPGLAKDQAAKLCYRAQDNKPVDCVKAAIDTWNGPGLSKEDAVKMCQVSGVFSIGEVQFTQKIDMMKSLKSFKNKFNLFQ